MDRRQPPASPLGLAEREADYQRAMELALRPARGVRAPGLVGAVRNLFAPADAARRTEQVYHRDLAWRPLLRADETASNAPRPAPPAAAPYAGPRVKFTLGAARWSRLKGL